MLLGEFKTDKNGSPLFKKCKYHCDYGDGEYCHYREEDGCIFNKTKNEQITDMRDHLYVVVKNGMYMRAYQKFEPIWVTKRDKNIWGTYDKKFAEHYATMFGGHVEEWNDEQI